MHVLPSNQIKFSAKCREKIDSYIILCNHGLPVLKSVLLEKNEVLDDEKKDIICKHLSSNQAMLRYIYINSCNIIKNGGAVVDITNEKIYAEVPTESMAWLIEPTKRECNRFCVNIYVNKSTETISLEILGKGFDISDLNKGYVSPHEIICMPYPLIDGCYGEWWKWIEVNICTKEDYQKSVRVREGRLKEFGLTSSMNSEYIPMPLEYVEKIRFYISRLEQYIDNSKSDVLNISCSIMENGRFVFWDIQTPGGKREAYSKG